MNGSFKVDFSKSVITVTAAFAKAMQNPTSEEYMTIRQIKNDFPGIEIVHRTHRTPHKYCTKSGDTFYCNQFKHLTYENMERFINCIPNNEAYMREFEIIKKMAAPQTDGYKLVRSWFAMQFPLFRSDPMSYTFVAVDPLSAEEVKSMYLNSAIAEVA